MRVVIYAEGAGETLSTPGWQSSQAGVIDRSALGPGHILVDRSLQLIDRPATSFLVPLRLSRKRFPRGSDLVDVDSLLQLCTWMNPARVPDLVIVLVDEDGDSRRRKELNEAVAKFPSPPCPRFIVVAVARQEFEPWLIADPSAMRTASGQEFPQPRSPEDMKPGRAKEILQRHVEESGKGSVVHEVRTSIMRAIDLQLLRKTCASFDAFLKELRARLV